MIFVLVVLLLAVIAGAVVLVARERSHSQLLEGRVRVLEHQVAEQIEIAASAEAAADAAARERDEALERESRARREAAEVARRMQDEQEARADSEAARSRLETELAAAEEAIAAGSDEQVSELWELALSKVRRTWEISVSPSPGMPCPLDEPDADPLRVAAEIEVDAAREESGAVIDLEWRDGGRPSAPVAVRTLTIVQELIARLAKADDPASIAVSTTEDRATVRVTGTGDDGEAFDPEIARDHKIGPSRWELTAS